jgi:Transposase IS116/IS110/IS902 family
MRNLISTLWSEWKTVEQQIEELGDELERISASHAGCTRIRQIPGVGPVVATAIVAAIGNAAAFCKSREFAVWLGIVPRQYSTWGKAKLLSISKRGNVYLRKILIHGARAAVLRIKRDRAPIGAWVDRLDSRAPKERCCRRHGQQARTQRLGCALQRQRLQTCRRVIARKRRLGLGGATRSHFSFPTKVCTGAARTKEQSQLCARNLVPRNGLQRPTDLEGPTRAQLIMARRADLHPKAEYICADLSSRPN